MMAVRDDGRVFLLALLASLLLHGGLLLWMAKETATPLPPVVTKVTPLQLMPPPPQEQKKAMQEKGANAVSSPDEPPPAPPVTREEQEMMEERKADYFGILHQLIDGAKKYPTRALRRRLEGDVTVRVVLNESGGLVSVSVLSGDEPFAAASVAAVRRARPFPPLPSVFGERLTFDVPLYYRLR